MPLTTWSRRSLICATLTLALMCCACGGQPTRANRPPPPDAALLQRCQPLPQPTDAKADTLLNNHIKTAQQYHQLCAEHDALIEAVNPPNKDPEPRWWQFWRIYF